MQKYGQMFAKQSLTLMVKGVVKMFPRGFENAYTHEIERRKDEMRDAAKKRRESRYIKRRKSMVLPIAILSFISWLLVSIIVH